jgi:hypothetical protein
VGEIGQYGVPGRIVTLSQTRVIFVLISAVVEFQLNTPKNFNADGRLSAF